jgi:hypothetical protein
MPTLLEMAAELTGQIPGLSRPFAQVFINRALGEVRRERLWSWNSQQGVLITPAALDTQGALGNPTGVVSVTQFSNLIQFDSVSQTTLNTLVLANPPITKYQFRIGSAGPIYSLVGYNPSNGQGQLDRIYGESTASGQGYTMYRAYYDPPSVDGITPNNAFLRYLSILNSIQGYSISGRRLYLTREDLDKRDPLRGALGYPYYVANATPSYNLLNQGATVGQFDGQMRSELWPHPTYSMQLMCTYEMKHVDLQPTDYIPHQCPASLIQYRAFQHAYRWAHQNSGRIPELKGVDWRFAIAEMEKKYAVELVSAKRNDNEIMLQILRPGNPQLYDFQGPIDSNFFQSHGLPAME